jgi:4-hydroxy-4-methyl-2-oxoglutarate aldolase
MMAEPPTLTLRRDWPRPSPDSVAAWKGVPTGFAVDALGRSGALGHSIRPAWDGGGFVGPALTVWTTPRDNLAPYAALRLARPGDVMRNCGIVAVVTDGLVRDVAGIREAGIPVHARGVSPNSPFKNGPGGVGVPVSIGGCVVEAGDLVIGDADGVVVVPRARLAEATAELEAVRRKEAEMDAAVRAGMKCPPWLDDALARPGVRWID